MIWTLLLYFSIRYDQGGPVAIQFNSKQECQSAFLIVKKTITDVPDRFIRGVCIGHSKVN
jgi:hypothetical protein